MPPVDPSTQPASLLRTAIFDVLTRAALRRLSDRVLGWVFKSPVVR